MENRYIYIFWGIYIYSFFFFCTVLILSFPEAICLLNHPYLKVFFHVLGKSCEIKVWTLELNFITRITCKCSIFLNIQSFGWWKDQGPVCLKGQEWPAASNVSSACWLSTRWSSIPSPPPGEQQCEDSSWVSYLHTSIYPRAGRTYF